MLTQQTDNAWSDLGEEELAARNRAVARENRGTAAMDMLINTRAKQLKDDKPPPDRQRGQDATRRARTRQAWADHHRAQAERRRVRRVPRSERDSERKSERKSTCKVCAGMEPEKVDRLLLVGYGPRFVSERWGHSRRDVMAHRDRCLTGGRLAATEAALDRMAGGGR